MFQFIYYACFFAPVLVLVGFVVFQVVNAWRFGRRADQLTRSRAGKQQEIHIKTCSFDIPVTLDETHLYVCKECLPYWTTKGAVIDKRGAPSLKKIGPEGVAV